MTSFHFKKTDLKSYQKAEKLLTADHVYWKKLGPQVLVKEFGVIDYVDFSPVEPHYFAVTCSVRVQIYNPITRQVTRNLSRFRKSAYGGSFRSDGRLLVAGGDENLVRLFDVQTKNLLRLFSGHEGPVHRAFFTRKQTDVVSFSDDKSVRVWDIAGERNVAAYSEHEDYVRAGCVSPVSPDIFASGGYDGKIKMYDLRTDRSLFTVDHESPVESMLFLPTGGMFLSCGGTDIKVWDALAGGKLLAKISQHHKTISCMQLVSDNRRLMSGSLDTHAKIYDLSTFKVVHTLDYPNAIFSLGVSPKDETVVVGMVDGLVSIRRREENFKFPEEKKKKETVAKVPAYVDEVISPQIQEKSARYDVCIKKFQYSKALDIVMAPYISSKTPEITVSIFQELIRRRALHGAIAGRDEKSLYSILKFLIKHLGDCRFTMTLIEVGNIFLDVYQDSINSLSPGVIRLLNLFEERVKEEIELTKEITSLEGMFSMLAAGGLMEDDVSQSLPTYNIPSENASKNFVINVL